MGAQPSGRISWKAFKKFLSPVPKQVLAGFLRAIGLLPLRTRYPCPGTWARDRYGRWELRVPARSLDEPSPDKR